LSDDVEIPVFGLAFSWFAELLFFRIFDFEPESGICPNLPQLELSELRPDFRIRAKIIDSDARNQESG